MEYLQIHFEVHPHLRVNEKKTPTLPLQNITFCAISIGIDKVRLTKTRDCGVTRSASARSLDGDRFEYRPYNASIPTAAMSSARHK